MLLLKQRSEQKALTTIMAWKQLTSPEEIGDILSFLGYRMEICASRHVLAIRETHTELGNLIEDARSVLLLGELPVYLSTFLGRVQHAFADPGYTISTPATPVGGS